MKAYLVTTGLLFGLITALHIWRAIAEWPPAPVRPGFVLGVAALVAVPAVLSWWAWRLLRNLANDRSKRIDEKMQSDDSDDSAV